VPQIQGVQGRSRSRLLQVLVNAEDEVSSAFPKGIQNELLKKFWFVMCNTMIHSKKELKSEGVVPPCQTNINYEAVKRLI